MEPITTSPFTSWTPGASKAVRAAKYIGKGALRRSAPLVVPYAIAKAADLTASQAQETGLNGTGALTTGVRKDENGLPIFTAPEGMARSAMGISATNPRTGALTQTFVPDRKPVVPVNSQPPIAPLANEEELRNKWIADEQNIEKVASPEDTAIKALQSQYKMPAIKDQQFDPSALNDVKRTYRGAMDTAEGAHTKSDNLLQEMIDARLRAGSGFSPLAALGAKGDMEALAGGMVDSNQTRAKDAISGMHGALPSMMSAYAHGDELNRDQQKANLALRNRMAEQVNDPMFGSKTRLQNALASKAEKDAADHWTKKEQLELQHGLKRMELAAQHKMNPKAYERFQAEYPEGAGISYEDWVDNMVAGNSPVMTEMPDRKEGGYLGGLIGGKTVKGGKRITGFTPSTALPTGYKLVQR